MRAKNNPQKSRIKRKRNFSCKKIIAILFVITLFQLYVNAQETIPASGGNASGNGGSVSYSVGQVVFSTNTGTSGSEAQGVQQPYEISIVTGNEQFKSINLTCSAFPNPTTDFLTLKIEGEIQPHFIASLVDLNGKILLAKKVVSAETIFPMGIFVPATYFLKIDTNNQEIKSFKIIKK
jgi:hypothetical protein